MSSTARAAWHDAWEGASTPSPSSWRSGAREDRDDRYALRQARARSQRQQERDAARRHSGLPTYEHDEALWAGDETASVVRLSAARARANARGERRAVRHGGGRTARSCDRARGVGERRRLQERLLLPDVDPIDDYDWDVAACRRPPKGQCERVILHADRQVEARLSSTRYYASGATARVPEPWPEARRRQAGRRPSLVTPRVPRWRLGVLAAAFGLLLVGSTVVAPMMMSSAVAGVEAAVGQTEAQQEQLAAETAALAAQISALSSPQRVAEEATNLGLAPAEDISYLSPALSGGPLLATEGDTTVAGR